ncbi:helix-turn-helix domain-containing protein [Fulvivirga lutea]|uniref:Helix-turn-helix domain-containing protein n=1 Tax=Fulvivirga lutea TaxID=2810512 RepID=A0A974WIU0_9BACT|nr:helix-turn-helix domain-containing protein [Fulvivirga lutea]QSE98970.1 helix-turn-helix domain-containing protein [Fulvivirga lutea]
MTQDVFFTASSIVIGSQILAVSVLLLFGGERKHKLLGVIGLIITLSFLYPWFQEDIADSTLLKIVFAGKKYMLLPPLLYSYLLIHISEDRKLTKHLIFPGIYIFMFLILQTVGESFYLQNRGPINAIHYITCFIYFLVYFISGIHKARYEIRYQLIRSASIKYISFFLLFNAIEIIYLFVQVIILFSIELGYVDEQNTSLANYYQYSIGLTIIYGSALLFYLLSESGLMRNSLLTKKVTLDARLREEKSQLKDQLTDQIVSNKLYTNPDFNLQAAANHFNINESVISSYFREHEKRSFHDYLHELRIKEFKYLVKQNNSQIYNLEGLANMAGFNSRATFYRVFKSHEKITPKEYLEKALS